MVCKRQINDALHDMKYKGNKRPFDNYSNAFYLLLFRFLSCYCSFSSSFFRHIPIYTPPSSTTLNSNTSILVLTLPDTIETISEIDLIQNGEKKKTFINFYLYFLFGYGVFSLFRRRNRFTKFAEKRKTNLCHNLNYFE